MESGYTYNSKEEMDLYNKCGFESIYSALYCEYPEILERHNITNIKDLYELVLNGINNKESIIDKYLNSMSLGWCRSHLNEMKANIHKDKGVYPD